jgi:hypothetical protein
MISPIPLFYVSYVSTQANDIEKAFSALSFIIGKGKLIDWASIALIIDNNFS